jgi:hypothetical protein
MTTTDAHAAAKADGALTRALIDLASRGGRPRCGGYGDAHLFLSEDEHDRQLATLMCAGCVVFEPCGEVGRHQRFGVFGGRDTTVRPGRKKAA